MLRTRRLCATAAGIQSGGEHLTAVCRRFSNGQRLWPSTVFGGLPAWPAPCSLPCTPRPGLYPVAWLLPHSLPCTLWPAPSLHLWPAPHPRAWPVPHGLPHTCGLACTPQPAPYPAAWPVPHGLPRTPQPGPYPADTCPLTHSTGGQESRTQALAPWLLVAAPLWLARAALPQVPARPCPRVPRDRASPEGHSRKGLEPCPGAPRTESPSKARSLVRLWGRALTHSLGAGGRHAWHEASSFQGGCLISGTSKVSRAGRGVVATVARRDMTLNASQSFPRLPAFPVQPRGQRGQRGQRFF